jgi:hypothetical protein
VILSKLHVYPNVTFFDPAVVIEYWTEKLEHAETSTASEVAVTAEEILSPANISAVETSLSLRSLARTTGIQFPALFNPRVNDVPPIAIMFMAVDIPEAMVLTNPELRNGESVARVNGIDTAETLEPKA